jgi:hypothetical protein
MHLVVFDVDGTLIDSSEIDGECMWQATREVLRLPNDHSPWIDDLRHVTDLCIVSQHCEKRFGRHITRSEVDLVRNKFVQLLRDALSVRESIELVTEGLELVRRTGERWYEAELHRLNGELSLLGFSGAESDSEQHFSARHRRCTGAGGEVIGAARNRQPRTAAFDTG